MLVKIKLDGVASMDAEQIFQLIDDILPFEVCLHYQVLPIALNQTSVALGMVDPSDQLALDYIQKILDYRNCSITAQPLSAEQHHEILSTYLRFVQQNRSGKTQKSQSTASTVSPSTSETQKKSSPVRTTNSSRIPALKLRARHLTRPVEVLNTLSPEELIHELLARAVLGGIGRLYFERQEFSGRILWSQDGVLQAILEDLPADQFKWLLSELKRLLRIALAPVDKPKQIELERTHREEYLLLRLRLVPGEYGEEANLQFLRGAALKFYQQQQLSALSKDALKLAQQLQDKLTDINERVALAPMPSENLPLLNQLLASLTEQAELLTQKNSESEEE
ncbi:MAG: hypothetical protein ACFBSC_02965 [Microcoleaceae cyanobacterium]